jgi:hypothetical protein
VSWFPAKGGDCGLARTVCGGCPIPPGVSRLEFGAGRRFGRYLGCLGPKERKKWRAARRVA